MTKLETLEFNEFQIFTPIITPTGLHESTQRTIFFDFGKILNVEKPHLLSDIDFNID